MSVCDLIIVVGLLLVGASTNPVAAVGMALCILSAWADVRMRP